MKKTAKKTAKKATKKTVKKATKKVAVKKAVAKKVAAKATKKVKAKAAKKVAVKAASKKRIKNISRIDQPERNTQGWYVRVYYQGKPYTSKFFSDKKNGGKRNGLKVATTFRDDEIVRLKKKFPDFDRENRRKVSKANSNTGVLGVSRVTYYDPRREKSYEYYSVSWRPEPGVSKITKFFIQKYGEKKAFKEACAFRKKKELEIYGPRRAKR